MSIHSTRLSTRSTRLPIRLSTRSTRLPIRLSIHTTRLSTLRICLSTRSTRSIVGRFITDFLILKILELFA